MSSAFIDHLFASTDLSGRPGQKLHDPRSVQLGPSDTYRLWTLNASPGWASSRC
jgi:hypothetical protein